MLGGNMRRLVAKLVMSISSAAVVLVQPALAETAEPIRLKPTSKWIADYQLDGCRMMRQFGEGDDKAIIIMNRFAPSDYFQLTLAGNLFKREFKGAVKLQFGSNEAGQEIDFLPGTFAEMPALLAGHVRLAPMTKQEIKEREKLKPPMYIPLSPLGAAREKSVTFLKVDKPLKKSVILELGAMDKPMAALSTCIDDLVRSWGVDPEKHKSLTRRATPTNNVGNWVTTGDYPSKMLEAGQPAIVNFRLLVDEKGAVAGCFIQQTTRAKEFDNAVCKSITRRAKFDPALDQDGKPLLSYYNNTVRFQPFG
jgi:Gram-negative bacterial TonB protein C-terminal